jgi:hypothetical protein
VWPFLPFYKPKKKKFREIMRIIVSLSKITLNGVDKQAKKQFRPYKEASEV